MAVDPMFVQDYNAAFEPETYLNTFYNDTSPRMAFGLTQFHEAFASGNIKGRQLLDFGTGPTIHSIISASQHCESILLAEFSPQNRDTLKQWHSGELKHTSHAIFLDYVLKLEGKGDSVSNREASMREKVSGIIPCDIRNENPFAPCFIPAADIITSSLCMEAVALSIPEYESYAAQLASVLRPGGHLVLFGCVGGSFYTVGTSRFSSFGMTSSETQTA
ncbi:indolethylamine N-methyltransferase-like [Haliotis rufescens]|uniref:indolethylamine N-methyltransferase-like n=1 Tax=Haliotis rufescens TaxID=6454 RepID=UPI00201F6E80|nr:indolethylamine N-methyltransferase-like [Haliotis rufescens]